MQNSWKVGLLLVALAVAGGCEVGRAAMGGGNGGGGGEPIPENIDGTYMIHSQNYRGEIRLPDEMAEMRTELRKIVFANGTMTKSNGMPGGEPVVEQIEIDRTKSPAQVTFTHKVSDEMTITNYGVMTMIGGQLTVCRQLFTPPKPEDRITQITNGEGYVTWKLKKENAAE
jgi:hypothetical protein